MYALRAAGHDVVCMTRKRARLDGQPWRHEVEVVEGDATDRESLDRAMQDCGAAFYLIHSMDGGTDFGQRDRDAARNFAESAAAAGISRIVYLGGLGRADDTLSEHLRSRQEVGRILASGPTPVTEVRAAVIIGSGSVSFEMLRHLTEVLPAMVTPRWVRTRCQPIAIGDILDILVAAVEDPETRSKVWEVGGPDRVSYQEMMQIYAQEAGLARRLIVPVPLLSPWLSKHWIGLVTPLPTGVAKPLIESLRNEVIVDDNSVATGLIGDLTSYRESVALALRTSGGIAPTRWSDAASSPAESLPSDPQWAGATARSHELESVSIADPESVFWAVARIGGDNGYYSSDWAWSLRGVIDSLVGGVGLRRGRRDPQHLRHGEALDFWRVSNVEPGRFLQLHAEMRLPGEAWLEWEIEPWGDGSKLRQKASFYPRGLLGRLYWMVLVPFHRRIFGQMLRGVLDAAERRGESVGHDSDR